MKTHEYEMAFSANWEPKSPPKHDKVADIPPSRSPANEALANFLVNKNFPNSETQDTLGTQIAQEQVKLYRLHLLSQLQHIDALLRLQYISQAAFHQSPVPFELPRTFTPTEAPNPPANERQIDYEMKKLAAQYEFFLKTLPANSSIESEIKRCMTPTAVARSGECNFGESKVNNEPPTYIPGRTGETMLNHEAEMSRQQRKFRKNFVEDLKFSTVEYKAAMLPRIIRLGRLTRRIIADREQTLEVRLRQLSNTAESTFYEFDLRERSNRNTLERQLEFAENQLEFYRTRMGIAEQNSPEHLQCASNSQNNEKKRQGIENENSSLKMPRVYDPKTQIIPEDEPNDSGKRMTMKGVVTDEAERQLEVFPLLQADGRFRCSLCERTFKFVKHARRHSLSHSQVRTFECPRCGSPFRRHDSLLRHQTRCDSQKGGGQKLHMQLNQFSPKKARPSSDVPPIVEGDHMRGKTNSLTETSILQIVDATSSHAKVTERSENFQASKSNTFPVGCTAPRTDINATR